MGFFNFFKRDISEEEFQEQQKVKRGLFPAHRQYADQRTDRR